MLFQLNVYDYQAIGLMLLAVLHQSVGYEYVVIVSLPFALLWVVMNSST